MGLDRGKGCWQMNSSSCRPRESPPVQETSMIAVVTWILKSGQLARTTVGRLGHCKGSTASHVVA